MSEGIKEVVVRWALVTIREHISFKVQQCAEALTQYEFQKQIITQRQELRTVLSGPLQSKIFLILSF